MGELGTPRLYDGFMDVQLVYAAGECALGARRLYDGIVHMQLIHAARQERNWS